MNRTFIAGYIFAIVFLAGCTSNAPSYQTPPSENLSSNIPTQTSPLSSDAPDVMIKEFSISVKQFEFDPGTIRVKQGDKVRLLVRSIDVRHGISLPEYNINVDLPPQKEQVIEFTADKKGKFTFFCNVPCGQGHKDMTGTLIVE